MGGHVQQQGALADARLTAEQGDRTGHEAAAEHAVELGHPRRHRTGASALERRDGRGHGGRPDPPAGRQRDGPHLDLLHQGVPALAGGTAPTPLGRRRTALGAPVDRLHLRHALTLRKGCHGVRDQGELEGGRRRRRSTTVTSTTTTSSAPR